MDRRNFHGSVLFKVGAHHGVRRKHGTILNFKHVSPVLLDLGIARLVIEAILIHVMPCKLALRLLVQLTVFHAFLLLHYFKSLHPKVGWIKEALSIFCHHG